MTDKPVEEKKTVAAPPATAPLETPASTEDCRDSRTSAEQSTENYIETYHAVSEWIRFADAKAAVILTVGGALAGFLTPSIHKVIADPPDAQHLVPYWQVICFALFGIYILFFLLSGVYAFLCISPIRNKGKHPSLDFCDHFHPAAIASKYSLEEVQKFVDDCKDIGAESLKREVQAAVLIDSHVSSKKYARVRAALQLFGVSAIFGFVYFLMAQL